MEEFNYFKGLAEKKRLTAADKAAIEEAAQTYGLTLNKNCPNCYRDAAIQIALVNKPEEVGTPLPDGAPKDAPEYELYPEVDIVIDSFRFGHMHVCAKECTPENARKWIAAGLPKRFFKHIPEE